MIQYITVYCNIFIFGMIGIGNAAHTRAEKVGRKKYLLPEVKSKSFVPRLTLMIIIT